MIPLPPPELMFMPEDAPTFIRNGDNLLCLADGKTNLSSGPVLDVGCGYGRLAYALHRRGFSGRYVGLDVLPAHVRWLQENFTPEAPNFTFRHVDVRNDRYNDKGKASATDLRIDVASPSLILVLSVFTHMFERDVLTYLEKIAAVMGPNSLLYATFFLMNPEQQRLEESGQSRYPMKHRLSPHCSTFDQAQPLHAIAYSEEWVRDRLQDFGLYVAETVYGGWNGRTPVVTHQDSLFIRRA